jgi:predicted DNA binding CopG/RHH family protein
MSEARKKVLIPAKRRETAEEAFIHHGLVRKGVKQTVSRTIRVTPGEFKAVQHRAIEEGVHYSDVIRAAICKYLTLPFDKDAGAR